MRDRLYVNVGSMDPRDVAKVIGRQTGVETLTWEKVFARRRGARWFSAERFDGWRFTGGGRLFRYRVQNREGIIWEI